uniref:Family with sequence similarity 185 member A n=1 Tax=Pavo cristatus TaxID=9049 RepID=A0A8C9EQZ8_PAVCR
MQALPPRWAPSVLRAVGGWCRGCSSSAELGGPKPLKEWTLVVGPRGRLRVRVPCQVSVRPLDPQRYPGADRVLVTVSGVERSARRHLEHVRVRYDEALQLLAIAAEAMDSKAAVDVRTPGKFDLDIKTSGTGCVKVQKMECDNCKIETEKGTSVLQSIKSHKINIRTNGGKVIGLGTLYGNTDIHATEKGSVNIEKLQGTSINISTEDGLLKTKYLYAESSSLSSVAGDILLGSIHGCEALAQAVQTSCGCFILGSAQGRVGWGFKQPDLLGGFSACGRGGGSITVKVPTSLKAYLELSGRKVDVSSEIELKETRSLLILATIKCLSGVSRRHPRFLTSLLLLASSCFSCFRFQMFTCAIELSMFLDGSLVLFGKWS